jgi:uncharacterized protein (TIGR02001 family)
MALRETLLVTRPWRTLIVIAVTASVLSHTNAARADNVQVLSGSVGGTTDFVFRGLSLTRGKPAAQASLDIEFAREYYVGAFVATADPNPGPSPPVEMDFWAGRYWRLSDDFSGDLRLSQYLYPDDPRRVSYDRTELTATLGFRNRVYFSAIYSPNTKAVGSSSGYQEGNVWAAELSARHPFTERLSLSAGVGHYGLDEVYDDSYNYWNVTFIATLAPFELQLAYLGVDGEAKQHFVDSSVENRVALTALWRFASSR